MLGLSFAARHPDRVGALALVGCGTYSENEREVYRQTMDRRLGLEGRRRMEALVRQIEDARESVERDRLLAEMGRLATEAQSFDLLEEEEVALLADAQGHRETWQDALRLQQQGIEPAAFNAIRSPVLMLHGDEDPHPGEMIRDTLRRFIPQLEYVGFPRCGHSPWRERYAREKFLQTLRDWLTEHSPRD